MEEGETIHVWLLHRSGPNASDSLEDYLRLQLSDPMMLQGWPRWLLPLLSWLLVRLRLTSLAPMRAQLEGPCPSQSAALAQAAELNRHLGPDFSCRPIEPHGDRSPATALKSTPSGSSVLLLPLIPQRCVTLYSLQEEARRHLRRHGAEILEVGSYAREADYAEAIAETVRSAIIDLEGRKGYGLLFICGRQPERWMRPPEDYWAEVGESMQLVMDQLSQPLPHHSIVIGDARLPAKLQDWAASGMDTLICIPLGWTCDHREFEAQFHRIKRIDAPDAGFSSIFRTEAISLQSRFLRMLADKVLDTVEESRETSGGSQ
jgi:protoheme ferro-lyase